MSHGGFIFVYQPSPAETFVAWRADRDPAVLSVEAMAAAARDRNALDLCRLRCPVVLQSDGAQGERVLIGDQHAQIRLDIHKGTALQGPIRLRYDLSGLIGLEPKILTLQRLLDLVRLGRFSLRTAAQGRPKLRAIMALRATDAKLAGAAHREIAQALFGRSYVDTDWTGGSDYLRNRVQRLVRLGRTLSRSSDRILR